MTIIEADMGKKKTRLLRGTVPNAKPKSAVSLAPCPWDMGASGKANQVGLIVEDRPDIDPETGKKTNPNGRRGARRDTWVSRYLLAGHITLPQANAARSLYAASHGKLRDDPLRSLRIYGGRIDGSISSDDPLAAAYDARRDFHRMWDMVPTFARPVIERVVLEDMPVWESHNSVVRGRHLDRLERGLEELASELNGKKARDGRIHH